MRCRPGCGRRAAGTSRLTYSSVEAEDEPGSDHYLLARGWATATMLRAPVDDADGIRLPTFDGAAGAGAGAAEPMVEVTGHGHVHGRERGLPGSRARHR